MSPMEQTLKDFGNLLGMQDLYFPPGKILRLQMETLGELDLLHENDRFLMRLSKAVFSLNKELFLNLLNAAHFHHLPLQSMRVWFQKPDRVGFGFIFTKQEATPDRLYQGLELLSKEMRRMHL